MRENFKKYIVISLLFFLGFIYQHKYINEFPSFIHAWAQSDRYALSLGFLDNGFNFFEPQTFVYNHQFPDNWKAPSETTITAVDFPIHDYVAALFMKIFGSSSPWVFRVYTLLYSLLGLFFLFKLSYAITKDFIKSVFIIVIASTSPVYVYYQGGFLPTVPSLSNAIIGIYFYYNYLKNNSTKNFYASILFLTLAALSRTTFIIPIAALLFVESIRVLKNETKLKPKIAPVCIAVLSLVSYLLYNGYLRGKYGSIFLNHLLPPNSVAQAEEILKHVYNNWVFQYFTTSHYAIFIIIICVAAYFFIVQKTKTQPTTSFFSLLAITYLFGCFVFACLMLRQFSAHDYYFLDTFFLPIILLLIQLLSLIPTVEKRTAQISAFVFICLFSALLILQPITSQEKRREVGFWDKTEQTIHNFKNSSTLLDSLGIPKASKMLVIDAVAPNIPFILMQRKGLVVLNTNRENVESALKWNFDYAVIQDEYFISDIYAPYPDILSKLKKIADNGKISVCKLTSNNQQSLLDFVGLDKKTAVLKQTVTFEDKPDSLWQNFNPSNKVAFSGKSSGYLSSDFEYGLTYKTKKLPELKNNPCNVFFSSYILTDTTISCEIAVSVLDNGQNIYYKTYDLKNLIKHKGTWEHVSLLFQVPKVQSNNYEFALFIWNTGKAKLYYDDFSFSIYE